MNISDVTILIASKSRKQLVTSLVSKITHRPLFIAIDEGSDDWPEQAATDATIKIVGLPPEAKGPCVAVDSAIHLIETKLVALLCDDVEPLDGWLDEALKVYNESFGDGDGVVSMNNGIWDDREIACFPLMSVAFYKAFCSPTGYERYYQDTEWTAKAVCLQRYAYAPKSIVTHVKAMDMDDEALKRDKEKFNWRMSKFYAIGYQSMRFQANPCPAPAQ